MTVAAIAVAGVGAAASIGGSMMSSKAQSKAAGKAQNAQDQNLAQQQLYAQQARDANIPLLDNAARQAMGYVSPYAQSGEQANTALQQGMGLTPDANGNLSNPLTENFNAQDYQHSVGYTPLTSNQLSREQYSQMQGVPALVDNTLTAEQYNQDPAYTPMVNSLAELQATPGYQFQLEQGLQGVDRTAAARGGMLSGRTLKEANNYAQGQASTGFQSAWDRSQQAYQNAFNRKQSQFAQGQQGLAAERAYTGDVYNQGQTALGNAYNQFTNNQNNAYTKLAGIAGTGANAAQNMGNIAQQNAQNIAQQNTNYANSGSGSSQNYADNTGNIAYGQGQQKANTAIGIGNQIGSSLTDIAGKYMSGSGGNNTNLGGNTGASYGGGTPAKRIR
jgi:hypothetical protein